MNNLSSDNMLKNYLHALIDNLDKDKIPKKLNIILDGGAFNGGYMYGILLYLKELENLNYTIIEKISGCSIGAVLGVFFLSNILEENINIYDDILSHFRKNHNLLNTRNILTTSLEKIDLSLINDKIFINYYNITTMENVVVSHFENKEELIEVLIRSAHIPYIIDGNILYKNKFLDGITPYIFPVSSGKTLYISSIIFNKLKYIFYLKNEVNIWTRLLTGVMDANSFFSNNDSEHCSYINNWTMTNFILFRFREIITFFIISVLYIFIYLNNKVPTEITSNIFILRFCSILEMLYKNILNYVIIG